MSTFHQWNNIAGHIFPIVIALFIGSWSDRRGRKIPLLIGLIGKLIYVLCVLLNIHFGKLHKLEKTQYLSSILMRFRFVCFPVNWPVQYIIYTATLPSALTGVDIVIFAASFAYISDITSVKNRTSRVTILEVCYLVTFPTGIALGETRQNA